MLLRQTAARRSADLYGFKLRSFLKSAAYIINNFPQCTSHRHFNQTGIFNRTGQGECFGSRASGCSDRTIPVGSLQNDLRYVGKRFYVVEDGRFLPQSFFYRSWRFDTRHASFSFDGCRQCTSLSTYKCTCSAVDMHMETEIRS